MKNRFRLSLLCAAVSFAATVHAGTLTVNLAFKGANQRAFWENTIAEFEKANPDVKVKAAYIDGKLVDAKAVAMLAALPSKIELLTKLVGTLKSPLYGLVTVLSGNQSGLVRVLNSIREQKEAAGSAA